MMMAHIGTIRSGRRKTHIVQSELDEEVGRNGLAILEIDEIDRSAWRRVSRPAGLWSLCECGATGHAAENQQTRNGNEKTQSCSDAQITQAHPSLPHSTLYIR